MPNGRARQRNTAHSNRQRNLQRDLAVVDSIPVSVAPVVVEAIELSESRSGEVKKLKGQIIGLKNKISNMEKKLSKFSELKEQKDEVQRTLESSFKLNEELWDDKQKAEVMINQADKFLAHLRNVMYEDTFDTDSSPSDLHDALLGTDYDKLLTKIRLGHDMIKYYDMVLDACRKNTDERLMCDGDDVFAIKYIGKKGQVKCRKVEVTITGNSKKDKEDLEKRQKKLDEERKLKESVVKNYSW